jgi:uncharacterized protein YjbJ (UPF0337 family)
MNREQLEGSWNVMKGKVREQWGRLTDDDLDVIHGRVEQLVGAIQQRYGKSYDEAEEEVTDWLDTVDSGTTHH